MNLALATCAALPVLDPDDRHVLAPLAARGVEAVARAWDDPAVDWAAYDLVVLRSTWDYPERRDEFLDWARSVPRLVNPADVIAWNTDKRYLTRLDAPVVPTAYVAPGEALRPPPGEYVVKPTISVGSRDTGRYTAADGARAQALVARLHSAGRTAMVQPYLNAVDTYGETALLYFAGRFSHAVRKGPMLDGSDAPVEGLYKDEQISPRTPTAAERAVGDKVVAALGPAVLYARVDLIPDADGSPTVVELELTEPSLFLGYSAGAADRFAEAIAARLA